MDTLHTKHCVHTFLYIICRVDVVPPTPRIYILNLCTNVSLLCNVSLLSSAFICKVTLLSSAVHAKCPYYVGLYNIMPPYSGGSRGVVQYMSWCCKIRDLAVQIIAGRVPWMVLQHARCTHTHAHAVLAHRLPHSYTPNHVDITAYATHKTPHMSTVLTQL